jgi:hypothetical protein
MLCSVAMVFYSKHIGVNHFLRWLGEQGHQQTAWCLVVSVNGYQPCDFCLHSFIMVFIYMMKGSGERPHPCLVPLLTVFHFVCFQLLL